ncbi:MAG TPA: isoprenylcysteine carboxylmethyltransferase family protein [Polyangiaceae bacterium]
MLHLSSPRGLSPTGVGPAIMVGQLAFLVVAIVANRQWPEATRLLGESSLPLEAAGALWLAGGIALWALTLRRFLRGFPRGELITSGPYRWCRHPLYASFVLFVVPGIGLITQTWTILLAALAGVAWASALIPREERAMDQVFGAAWRDYCAHTSRLIPFPFTGGRPRAPAAGRRASRRGSAWE